MNIKNFDDIKKISNEIRKIFKISNFQNAEIFYEFYRTFSGPKYENCKRCEFFKNMQVIEEFPIKLNHFEKLTKWLTHDPNYQKYLIGLIKRENLYKIPKGLKPPKKEEENIKKSSKLLSVKWTSEELAPAKQLSIFEEINSREKICVKILK